MVDHATDYCLEVWFFELLSKSLILEPVTTLFGLPMADIRQCSLEDGGVTHVQLTSRFNNALHLVHMNHNLDQYTQTGAWASQETRCPWVRNGTAPPACNEQTVATLSVRPISAPVILIIRRGDEGIKEPLTVCHIPHQFQLGTSPSATYELVGQIDQHLHTTVNHLTCQFAHPGSQLLFHYDDLKGKVHVDKQGQTIRALVGSVTMAPKPTNPALVDSYIYRLLQPEIAQPEFHDLCCNELRQQFKVSVGPRRITGEYELLYTETGYHLVGSKGTKNSQSWEFARIAGTTIDGDVHMNPLDDPTQLGNNQGVLC